MASAWSQLDQLLTCAICLDRYRNPKLLPCQHTFCMEPCLDGLIDYARRQIKCPECRAEHRIPYKGIQEFPTNVTLMRFLELHRDITGEEPEPPPSMMERCNVCSEKSNLERCAHCDKKICPDCKEAHVDILRREINRINNQVRRGLHRLSEALTQTKKNAEKLQINCNQVKDEIEDIVRRYSKDLRHTEEKLKHDLEIYTEKELKSINKLKEDLEAEVSNMTSNCDLVDKHVKDDAEWSDLELLEYKDIFLKTLDFLRSFDPDNSDFARRIKFQPRADPDVLHRNIADFGELKINTPPSSVTAQQSLMPPQSNALMRSQSDHRLAAQFARRTADSRSYTDRYSGHASDNERESGRPTSPLSRSRRDADGSGYRRFSERSRAYDYPDRPSNRYLREDNSSSSILSSRWRESEDYGHRSHINRDYEDHDSEPQQNSSRTVRFADDPPQRERAFDMGDATKGPLSGVVRLMDSPKIMERLHQNEVRQKQPDKETKNQDSQPTSQSQPEPRVTVPTTPPVPTRKTPSRQQSEDDIDRQKKANQQQASMSSTTQPPVSATPEAPLRPAIRKGSSETTRTPPAVDRTLRINTTENAPLETVSSNERPETTRIRKPQSNVESLDEADTTTSSSTTSQSRCARPSLGQALSLDGGEAASAKPALDKKVQHQLQKSGDDPDEESDSEEEEEDEPEEAPKPVQSSFFSRQRRLPDPEPRLLLESDDDVSEGEEESNEEEEEEETKTTDDVPLKKSDEDIAESDSEDSSSSTSSSSESESEDSDAFEDENIRTDNTEDSSLKSARRSSDDHKARDLPPSSNTNTTRNQKYSQESDAIQTTAKNAYDEEDGDEDIADLVDNLNTEPTTLRRRSSADSDSHINDSNRQRPRRRSDDADTTDSSSCSSSAPYHSLSCNTTPLSNGTPCTVDETISSEGSTSSTSTNSYRRESRFSSAARRRPVLARSKSSHELGLGYEATEDMDEDEDDQQTNTTPSYRSRADRMSEGNNHVSKTRTGYGSTTNPDTSTDNPSGLSTTSNNTWAKYLKNKYGNSAASKVVVPRSRSSHALYKRSESDSSEDESTSTRNSILPDSYGFSNPRSTYMQKRRMLLKIGTRGTEPANFTWPRGIAVGPENSIVVADSSNHRVQVFDAIGKFLHEFGTYGSCEGEFDCLAGVAVNRIGQYIVSDRYNHRIQLFDPTGRFLRAFGCEGRTDGRFNYPWGITTDSLGFIYVCDKENHRIQVFQSDGTFVGKFGSAGSRPGQLEHPHYIAVSNTNRVIVSDTNNHRIQIFDVNGRSLSTFGTEGSSEGQFKFPRGVAVDDQGFIIVGDSGNNRIQIFHPDGTFLRGFGTWGSAEGEFKGLEGIAVTSGGSIMVCDRENHRIQVF